MFQGLDKITKKLRFFTALVCAGMILGNDASAASLAESVELALKTHPSIVASREAGKVAKETVRESRSGFFPTLSINSKAGRVHADDDTTRGATADNGSAQSWLGEANITLTQPVFDGFGVWNRYGAAKERSGAAAFDTDAEAEDLALKVARAHLNMMRTRELLASAYEYMESIQKNRDSISLLVREGAADAAEQLQADQIMMAAQATKLGYDELYRRADADYIEAVGQQADDALSLGNSKADSFLPKSADDAIVLAAAQHPQLKSAAAQAVAYARDANAEKSTLLPRVDAELSWMERDQHDDLGGEATNGQAMLRLSWGLETGGAQFARAARSLSQRDMALASQRDLLRTLERDIRQKYASLEVSEKQLAILEQREQANEKILENYKAQFEGGNRSVLQLIGAQSSLFDSKAARIDAYYRQQLARFEALQAIGSLRDALGVATEISAAAR